MLTYLAEAARAGLVVVAYEDEADATMALDGTRGRFTEVVLRPAVTVARGSDLALARRLHETAHAACFIARSMNFPLRPDATLRAESGRASCRDRVCQTV